MDMKIFKMIDIKLTRFSLGLHSSKKLAITIPDGLQVKVHITWNQSPIVNSSNLNVDDEDLDQEFTIFSGVSVSISDDLFNKGDDVVHVLSDS